MPHLLLILAAGLHIAGRIAATGTTQPVDSITYAVAAYRLYTPPVSMDNLLVDKPPGQAVLTGWVYRILPGPLFRETVHKSMPEFGTGAPEQKNP